MSRYVTHDLKLELTRDERAAQAFVSALRSHVLNDMAAGLKQTWQQDIEPGLLAPCTSTVAVHDHLKPNRYFQYYSATRVAAQEMVWASVRAPVLRAKDRLESIAQALAKKPGVAGSLQLDPSLVMPEHVSGVDVHLMPGNYQHAADNQDLSAGAIYDNGLSVFSFGLMGQTLDDIGQSITTYVAARWPQFAPRDILDLGCTIGHQTVPWTRAYPAARVTGIDVAAPCLRYAHARAQSLGLEAHFRQADARATGFADNSFDLIFSSMFLHELPVADMRAVFAEIKRLLRPGGLMLHYELPPNDALTPFDGFYLDWDGDYNNEPYYKGFRDQNLQALCTDAGFAARDYVAFVTPSLGLAGADSIARAATGNGQLEADGTVGRLADGIQWFAFGSWA